MTLRGKRALVTGSTSGIGLGIAEQLARAGCSIVLNGFGDPAVIESLRARLAQEHGVDVAYESANVSDGAQCRALVERSAAAGSLDILVNNAGIQHVAPIESFAAERWDQVLAINLSSAFHLIAAALPAMRTRGYGRIVNIASVHGLVASRDKAAYVAAKHGLIGLTKVVALETAGQGVTANAICPGWVLTPLVDAQIVERMRTEGLERSVAEKQMLAEKQPAGEFATPEQIGSLAVFLCSAAAGSITGASLPVDGGWTAQ